MNRLLQLLCEELNKKYPTFIVSTVLGPFWPNPKNKKEMYPYFVSNYRFGIFTCIDKEYSTDMELVLASEMAQEIFEKYQDSKVVGIALYDLRVIGVDDLTNYIARMAVVVSD